MTNVGPEPRGARRQSPHHGQQPLAFALPTFGAFPFTLDISLSNVAGGKLLLASKKGEKIPLDWATDKRGARPMTPTTAFAGFLLAAGRPQGPRAVLRRRHPVRADHGRRFQFDMTSMYKHLTEPSRTGHFIIVINPLRCSARGYATRA